MGKAEMTLKSAGPAGTSTVDDTVHVHGSTIVVRWSNFMLTTPRPAESLEDQADLEVARRVLAEPGHSVPYEDVRRELGLA